MDPQDIRSLHILEEIENEYASSQRDLARKLDISLGLVNSFMKRLAKKGYVKIATIPRNRVKYILTPQGFAEKTRLTYEFIHYSFRFYKKALGRIEELLEGFNKGGITKVAFYGATDLAEIAFISLRATGMNLVCIIDEEKKGQKFLGRTIKSIKESLELDFDKIIVTTFDSKGMIYDILQQKKIPREKIVMLDS
jgi:DNA-binding MarR family transcriptional regulator